VNTRGRQLVEPCPVHGVPTGGRALQHRPHRHPPHRLGFAALLERDRASGLQKVCQDRHTPSTAGGAGFDFLALPCDLHRPNQAQRLPDLGDRARIRPRVAVARSVGDRPNSVSLVTSIRRPLVRSSRQSSGWPARRATAWFAHHDVTVERVLTDNAKVYRIGSWAAAYAEPASSTGSSAHTARGQTGRPSGSTGPCSTSSPTPRPGCPTPTDSLRSTTGSTPTTLDGPTPPSTATRPSPGSPAEPVVNNLMGCHTWKHSPRNRFMISTHPFMLGKARQRRARPQRMHPPYADRPGRRLVAAAAASGRATSAVPAACTIDPPDHARSGRAPAAATNLPGGPRHRSPRADL
jgi:hypothetical protein